MSRGVTPSPARAALAESSSTPGDCAVNGTPAAVSRARRAALVEARIRAGAAVIARARRRRDWPAG